MKKTIIALIASLPFLFWSCQNIPSTEGEQTIEIVEIVMEKDGIQITSVNDYTQFPDATLALSSPTMLSDTGQTAFEFVVENYMLGEETMDVFTDSIANSASGQHIHVIWDNQPYMAKYEPKATIHVEEGHHVLLAFLARSYHMSVKTEAAHIVHEYTVGDYPDNFDETAAHIFYSRPKGEYVGEDAEHILLDFYLLNTDLENDGYSVNLTIDSIDFILDSWMPYLIDGLSMGEHSIRLELLDNDGNRVESPFNPVERTIVLKENS